MSNRAYDRFSKRLDALEHTRVKAEKLFADKQLARRDTESVYEGLFLRCVTAFEAYLEDVFHAALSGNKHGTPKGCKSRIGAIHPVVAGDLIRQGKNYADWLPYDLHTEKRAWIYFVGGRPFTLLSKDDRKHLEKLVLTRHAIAHASDHARKRFVDVVLADQTLRADERPPAGYLRSQYRSSPATTRYEWFVNELRPIAKRLS